MSAALGNWFRDHWRVYRDRGEVASLTREVNAWQGQGRDAEALAAARELVERQRARLGERSSGYAVALGQLGRLLGRLGHIDEAEATLRLALDARRASSGDGHPLTAASLEQLAALLQNRGNLDGAEELLDEVLVLRARAGVDRDGAAAAGLTQLAQIKVRRGETGEARRLLTRALELRRAALGERHPFYATSLSNLGRLLLSEGRVREAEPLLRRALEVRQAVLGSDHPDTAESRDDLTRLEEEASDRTKLGATPDPTPHPEGLGDPTEALHALGAAFATLAERFAQAAEGLRAFEQLPAEGLLRDAWACRQHLEAVRSFWRSRAEAIGLRSEADIGLKGLFALAAAVGRDEALWSNRTPALELLTQVLDLRESPLSETPGWPAVCSQAEALRDALAGARRAVDLPLEAADLAQGTHPLAAVVRLTEAGDGLEDAAWSDLFVRASAAFGRAFAAAAARQGRQSPVTLPLNPRPPRPGPPQRESEPDARRGIRQGKEIASAEDGSKGYGTSRPAAS